MNNNNKMTTTHRGQANWPPNVKHKQQGFSLYELCIVVFIIFIFMILALRHYHDQKKSFEMDMVKQNVQLLADATDQYYYAHCSTNVDYDVGPKNQNMNSPFNIVHGADEAKKYLNPNGTQLSIEQLQDGGFLDKNLDINNSFLQFSDGDLPTITLQYVESKGDYCDSNPGDNAYRNAHPHANCFGQSGVWQTTVSICVNANVVDQRIDITPKYKRNKDGKLVPVYPDSDKPVPVDQLDKTAIRTMFGADDITTSSNCKNGYILKWKSIPRVQKNKGKDEAEIIQNAMQFENNQQYRYGPWMQENNADPDDAKITQEGLKYLCQ